MSATQRDARLLEAAARDGITVYDLRGESFDTIKAYWRDPAPFDAETERNRATANAAIDAAVRKNHPHIGGDA
ncbi:hypothetical protein [Sphingomonas sp.]|uniref:hypothetical protein n=1 Tax=Sphingomonas sp. TaxID=28214 RepID=UPI003BAC8370